MWKYVNMNNICVWVCLVLLFLYLIWRSNLVDKDHQQDPPSLPLARLEQELRHWLLIRSCFNAEYNSKVPWSWQSILNKLTFYPPFLPWSLWGLLLFHVLGGCKIERFHRTTSHSFLDRLSFWRFLRVLQIKSKFLKWFTRSLKCVCSSPKAFWYCLLFILHSNRLSVEF